MRFCSVTVFLIKLTSQIFTFIDCNSFIFTIRLEQHLKIGGMVLRNIFNDAVDNKIQMKLQRRISLDQTGHLKCDFGLKLCF